MPITLHDIERSELVQTLGRWLDDRRGPGPKPDYTKEIAELERLLAALRPGGSLCSEDADLLLLVMNRQIYRLEKLLANPESYLGPLRPPPVSGLFKSFKLRRAMEEQSQAREESLRGLRREVQWLQLLAAKIQALKQ